MLTLYIDALITRRIRMNYVLDEDEQLIFSAPDLGICITFLKDRGETHADLVCSQYRYRTELLFWYDKQQHRLDLEV